ncbi:hypothetical protein CROQUDRAFT_91399 [Cronartium quercuum f. sp. fusiforme G11]|uniref:Uncharacterized protein n=1 Tax=Cronartium quercuum f. sp. fusiforme G11 TaxID=708437 RepID=A0A9P6NQ16_9BASI|nr:hypothetical protein CROQUDRAFT_91399 [Cronartium quercuum f. sp. fusiforme G11]
MNAFAIFDNHTPTSSVLDPSKSSFTSAAPFVPSAITVSPAAGFNSSGGTATQLPSLIVCRCSLVPPSRLNNDSAISRRVCCPTTWFNCKMTASNSSLTAALSRKSSTTRRSRATSLTCHTETAPETIPSEFERRTITVFSTLTLRKPNRTKHSTHVTQREEPKT